MRVSRTYSRRGRSARREISGSSLGVLRAVCVCTCVTALAIVSLPALAQAQTTLQYHWKQGDVVTYKTTLETDSTASGIPGMSDVAFGQTMTQRIRLLAAAVAPDGAVTLHQTIEAVRVEMRTPMGKVGYDSEDPKSATRDEGAEALSKVFGGIVGGTLSVTMAPNGAIQRIDGVQKIVEKITQELPEGRAGAQMAQSLRTVMSDDSIRAALEQSFPRLPANPVKPGESWTSQVSLGGDVIGKITGTQTMTLNSADAASATIGVTLALKQESAPPVGPSGMTVKLGDGKGEGEMQFDVANGRIRKSTMRTDIPSTMNSVGPDGRPVTMKNTAKTTMTMEIVEK
jgi:hypothetical protein